jgi:TolB-like protein
MNSPDMNNTNATHKPTKRPIATMSWVILLIGLAAIVFAIYSAQNTTEEAPIETITREGIVTQIQQLNRLHTVAFSVDTVITSERPGSWMKLWQDEQKALFIAHGRVEAGVDLSALTPEMVQVVQPTAVSADVDGEQVANAPTATMPQINITLPPTEIFSVYLDDIEIYDWQTGAFGMMQVDPKILAQAQTMAKKEVLERACRGDVMNMALQNAQTQLQQLFALTGAVVTVTTQGAGACQLPVTTKS